MIALSQGHEWCSEQQPAAAAGSGTATARRSYLRRQIPVLRFFVNHSISNEMAEESNQELTLQLQLSGATRMPMKIAKTATSSELRKAISETTKIPPSALKVIFRGRLIADDASAVAASEFKLEDGSVVHCMGKPATGGGGGSDAVSAAAPATAATNPAAAAAAAALPAGPTVSTTAPHLAAASAFPNPPSLIPPRGVDPLVAALHVLRSNNPPDKYRTAVTTLDKILENIVKVRRIRPPK